MGNYARKSDRHPSQLSRDEKKLSSEDCFVGEEIAENNFEKGEDDSYLDPYALSYVDEKLQSVLGHLGHFLEDFQGDLSAEKLGARFGGYGSFLGPFESSPPRAQNSGRGKKGSKKIKHIEKSPSPSNLVEEEEDMVVVFEAPVMKSSVLYIGLDTPSQH